MKSKKSAFTLIELLVVIAIIGILSTLAVVALQSARKNARDAKRVADVRQIQTALELYYNDVGQYPEEVTSTISYGSNVYMATYPSPPAPPDGECSDEGNNYVYAPQGLDRSSYTIDFCTGGPISSLLAGNNQATPEGIFYIPPPQMVSGFVKHHNVTNSLMFNVTIYLKQNGETKYTATTSSSGNSNFIFPEVTPGTYDVHFSLPHTPGSINSTDAANLNYWLSNGLPDSNLYGLQILAGDVYETSVSTIITSEDAYSILDYFVSAGSDAYFVFTKEEYRSAIYSSFPIPFASGGSEPGISSMKITVPVGSDVVQNFYSSVYGDINRSYTP